MHSLRRYPIPSALQFVSSTFRHFTNATATALLRENNVRQSESALTYVVLSGYHRESLRAASCSRWGSSSWLALLGHVRGRASSFSMTQPRKSIGKGTDLRCSVRMGYLAVPAVRRGRRAAGRTRARRTAGRGRRTAGTARISPPSPVDITPPRGAYLRSFHMAVTPVLVGPMCGACRLCRFGRAGKSRTH